MKEAVNEDHQGKRKNEAGWKIHRLHWEKNRFIYDLMYVRKVMSKELFDWLVREKIADGAIIAKWRKPGYEILCSMLAIQKGNHNFGTTSLCRVPMKNRTPQQRITPDVQTGCICCASGDGKFGGPIWWNTPMNEEENAEDNRAIWTQEGLDSANGGVAMPPPPFVGAKGGHGELSDEEDLEDDVKKRLEALRKR